MSRLILSDADMPASSAEHIACHALLSLELVYDLLSSVSSVHEKSWDNHDASKELLTHLKRAF